MLDQGYCRFSRSADLMTTGGLLILFEILKVNKANPYPIYFGLHPGSITSDRNQRRKG